MKISQRGIDAIKAHEGVRLHAYLDVAGIPTVGVGHTQGVELGQQITQAQADEFLREDLAWVERCIAETVQVPLTQQQYDALASLIFNIGATAFKDSTLLRTLNAGDYSGAAEQFLRWNKARVNGVMTVVPGLASRRAVERSMFLEADPIVHIGPEPMPNPPRPDQEPYVQPEKKMPIPALVTALLPTVVQMIPRLATIFKPGSEVAERNVAAASAVMDIVTQATGAVNAQAAVEAIKSDPVALAAATKAVERDWFELHKASEESTAAARQFGVTYAQNHEVRVVLGQLTFLEVLSFLLVISTLAGGMAVLIWGQIDAQLKGAVVTLMLVGGYTSVISFWFGSSLGSKKKDDKA